MLAVGTTFHCFPMFYHSAFTYFQVLRVARLLKSSPLLEAFLNKVRSQNKRAPPSPPHRSLPLDLRARKEARQSDSIYDVSPADHIIDQYAIILLHQKPQTIRNLSSGECIVRSMLLLSSSLQSGSSQAYMSMFRIVMNDGWTEVMYSAMDEVYDFGIFFVCLTALFFIFFHLLTNSVSVQRIEHEHERTVLWTSGSFLPWNDAISKDLRICLERTVFIAFDRHSYLCFKCSPRKDGLMSCISP